MESNKKKSNLLKRLFIKESDPSPTEKETEINPLLIRKSEPEIDKRKVLVKETQVNDFELSLMDNLNSFQYIFDNLSSGIWMRESLNGKFVFASKGLEDILQIPLNKLYEDSSIWLQMVHPSHRKELDETLELVSKGKTVQILYRLTSGEGKTKWLLEQIVPKVNSNNDVHQIFGMVTDITHEMHIEEQLSYLEEFDSLTDLPNQKSLFKHLDFLCRSEEPFAVLYLDIDRFNVVNNSLGYAIGDEALKLIAKRFSMLTPVDGYLARLNGNDFIMIVKNFTDVKEIYRFAEEINKTIAQPFTIQDYVLHLSTSIGITFYPEEGRDRQALLENAHTALYQAKRQGKNNYQLYSHSKDIPSFKKYVLDRDMRNAINNEEFELFFQPQVEPSKGLLVGAEVLIRWHHPEWGDISPAEFIPLAEENHMINMIIDWEIEQICSLLNEWNRNNFPLYPVSINVSPIRFMKKGLVEYVAEQIKKYNVNPKYLELEITESSLLKTDNNVLTILKELKELGVKVSVDDFGTGYSSLDYLRNIKPDTIKIDKTFTQNINAQSEIDKGVISSVLFLGKRLGMKVVAEGVEEIEQLEFLKQNECDIIQGYLFSPPVPQSKYEKMIQVGYLKPEKRYKKKIGSKENRNFYRLEFPFHVKGRMTIAEVNNQAVNVGSTPILLENMSLGGIKILSNLKLPVNSNMKFEFEFTILNETIRVFGGLRWIDNVHPEVYSYGVSFNLNRSLEDRLAKIINRITTLKIKNEAIPDTDFIYEHAVVYFRER
ncbi:PAS domain S-box-containing protein/diguanylate cyclase (GGDEF)-like protein [Ureibacillus xyleni]|uniref:PAS domain S-box-containing protein/diguanylate cyclase (GGDEF)-like protein n=1 Tax=Ureibacillus xyleni TaxID=614648 RepID=A0A285TLU1_9BACL|nr:EAL domain-containing protein [Ureibacillus xyleni]SOC23483.1 PAS domain S-box-containing protein/diguanylate cyclase (GGDEF)-like protein [Ureibacillus xyleni]